MCGVAQTQGIGSSAGIGVETLITSQVDDAGDRKIIPLVGGNIKRIPRQIIHIIFFLIGLVKNFKVHGFTGVEAIFFGRIRVVAKHRKDDIFVAQPIVGAGATKLLITVGVKCANVIAGLQRNLVDARVGFQKHNDAMDVRRRLAVFPPWWKSVAIAFVRRCITGKLCTAGERK